MTHMSTIRSPLTPQSGAHAGVGDGLLKLDLRAGSFDQVFTFAPSFDPGALGREPVAVFGALTMPAFRGNEVGFDFMLHKVIQTLAASHAYRRSAAQHLTNKSARGSRSRIFAR